MQGEQKMGTGDDGKNDRPPVDDVCPICFDDFTIPSKTCCGHWYCAGCILAFWSHRGGKQICRCPKCDCGISKLMLVEDSLLDRRGDDDVVKIMERVAHYNGLYNNQLPPRPPPPAPRPMPERLRRLLLSIIKGYICIAVPLSLIVVFLTFLPRFVDLPHETEKIVGEWLWWASFVNLALFKCLPNWLWVIRVFGEDLF